MAIAYSTSGAFYQSTSAASATVTINYGGGSNGILVAFLLTNGANNVTNVQWNGTSLTQIGTAVKATSDTVWLSAWYLLAPASGNYNLTANFGTNTRATIYGGFYTGAKQTGQPDASGSGVKSGNPHSQSVTTVAANCWIMTADCAPNRGAFSSGSNFSSRQDVSAQETIFGDSNGSVGAAGSKTVSVTYTLTPSTDYPMFAVSIAPTTTTDYTITADAGSYTLTGTAAVLKSARTMAAAAGSYVLTGTDAALKRGYGIVAEAGSYALTGTAATLTSARRMVAAAGSYALTGTAAALKAAFRMVAGAGSYILTGFDAGLTSNAWSKPSRDSSSFAKPSRDSSSFAKPSRPSSTWTRPDDPNQ